MKKLILFILLLTISFGGFSQTDSKDKAAKITNEMSEVLSLNKEEKTKVYAIQLKRFQEVKLIRETHKENPETKKTELKKVYDRLYGKLLGNLGKEKMLVWKNYKLNN